MLSPRPHGRRSGIEIQPGVLREARLRVGLSLAQVGGPELSRQAVHLIETGKARPSLRSLQVIAVRLGIPMSAVLARPEGDPRALEPHLAELDRLSRRHEHMGVVDCAERLLHLEGSPRLAAFAHLYAGQALYYLQRADEALNRLGQAASLFDSLDDPWFVAESMDWEAMVWHLKEDVRALAVSEEALRRYRSLEERQPETEARMLEHLGTILTGRGSYAWARACYDEALQVAGGVRDLARIARIYHGQALCAAGLGDLRSSTELLFKAIGLYEAEMRISPRPNTGELARAENDLGFVLMEQGDLDRADALLNSSLDHLAGAGIERVESHVLLSLGELRQRQGQLDAALQIVRRAVDQANRFHETRALATGHRQLGELHALRGEGDLAAASFERALAILDEAGLDELRARCLAAYERAVGAPRQPESAGRSGSA